MDRKMTGKWASLQIDKVVADLQTDPEVGLTEAEASRRLSETGLNEIAEEKEESLVSVILEEIREPMILILFAVGILYSILGNVLDSITIFTIIILIFIIEIYNIYKARRSLEALSRLTSLTAPVYRGGKLVEIDAKYIVPGDLLLIKTGQRIPADSRLIRSYSISADESALTGESFPVRKDADTTMPEDSPLAELRNMVFSGTLIVQGEGEAIVTETGSRTEIGAIAELAGEVEEKESSLEKSVSRLTYLLVGVAAFFSILIPAIGYLQGQEINSMILTGLSLAFATVPEELPIIITIVLAVGAFSLSKKKAIVKSIRAAETLGGVTVIATDKTGTITENMMEISHLYFSGILSDSASPPDRSLVEFGVLTTGTLIGTEKEIDQQRDPMVIAVYNLARQIGVDFHSLRGKYRTVEEFGFDNKSKLASYLFEHNGRGFLFTSGAPEEVLKRSEHIMMGDEEVALDNERRSEVIRTIDDLSSGGERVIGLAFRRDAGRGLPREDIEKGYTFVGLISFLDPPRKDVPEVIRLCQEAGIRVIMITGDHPNTARKIARDVGINNSGRVITGPELSRMDAGQLKKTLEETSIFARIASGDKLRIVDALRGSGEVVAVTGDGVNDSPALRTAEIGIAMGDRGTDAAKESADMILADDNFVTIVDAVREGRKIYETLKKGIKYYISVKIALVSIFMLPLLLSIPFPFSPIQIIVLELFMDVGALSGFLSEREEAAIMKKPPRDPESSVVSPPMLRGIFMSSGAMFAAVSFTYLYTYATTGELLHSQTVAFATWILSHIFLALNLRTESEPLLRRGFFSNRIIVLWAVAVAVILIVSTVFPFLQEILRTSTLRPRDWIFVLSGSMAATFWMEAVKWFRYTRKRIAGRRSADSL